VVHILAALSRCAHLVDHGSLQVLHAAGSSYPATSGIRSDRLSVRREIAMRRFFAALRSPDHVRSDEGMSTAEYAVGTVAACGFGALLFKILTSGFATSLLESIISRALHLGL
jgi:hypothetical protein